MIRKIRKWWNRITKRDQIQQRLCELETRLSWEIRNTRSVIMSALDDLKREVEETKTVVDSAITLLGNLSQYIRDNVNNADALTELANDLDGKQAELAAAIEANTVAPPSDDPPADDPPVDDTPVTGEGDDTLEG